MLLWFRIKNLRDRSAAIRQQALCIEKNWLLPQLASRERARADALDADADRLAAAR
jgi:hypothetical protein